MSDEAWGEIVRIRIWWSGQPGDEIDKRLHAMLPPLDSGCGFGVRDVACFLPREAAERIAREVREYFGCESEIIRSDA